MDLNTLCGVLQACMSADQQERAHAEEVLKQHEKAPGQIVNLLRVAAEQTVDINVRQVAAISFKNIVKRNWEPAEGQPETLAAEDKQVVRDNILESLLRAPHIVQTQLTEVVKSVIYCDFPEKWTNVLEVVYNNLTSPEEQRVYAGLLVLRLMTRKYEFADEEKRGPLAQLVVTTFPVLLQLFTRLLSTPPVTQGDSNLAEYQKLICKVFWSATFMGIPELLLQEEQFKGWMNCFHMALTRPVPWAELPSDPDDRPKWVVFKALKWVLHITHRIFSRYSEPHLCSEGSDKAFAELFVAHVGNQFLEDHLAVLQPLAGGQYMSPRVVNLALQYLTHAIEVKKYYLLLKPHIEPLLAQVVLPQLCFSAEDAELWVEDPQEFVRKGYDVLEDMFSTKTAAANFLHTMCYKKPKAHLQGCMAHLQQVLVAHDVAVRSGAPVPDDLARKMDGALLAVGTLNDVLKVKSPYKDQLEVLLLQYVMPCFSSHHAHLRAKAAWVVKEYCDIDFKAGGKGQGHTFHQLLTAVINCLQDSELPVRVEGVVALRSFVDTLEDLELLKPILSPLLEGIFRLMNEVDNEELVFTLETVVEKFGDEIAPFALGTTEKLAAAFWKYCSTAEEDDEDDMAAVAAYGCLRAINTVLDGVSELKHMFPLLENICWPIMQRMISTEGQDLIEDVLEMLAYFTFFAPEVSPRLWTLWPQMHKELMDWGVDYWEAFLPPLDNFISRDVETYLRGSGEGYSYQDSVFQMVSRSLSEDFSDGDVVPAARLIEVVLQNCRGRVDAYLEPFLQVVLARLAKTESRVLRDALQLVVANALYYNPAATLAIMSKMGALAQFFTLWSSCIFKRRGTAGSKPAHFRRQHDKKVAILGLLSVLQPSVPDAALPPELAAGLPQLLSGIMRLLLDLKTQQEEAENAASTEEEEEEDDLEADDEDQQPSESDVAYMKRLQKAAKEMLTGQAEDDDDEDDDDWDEEEEVIGTPLDDIDPFESFAEVLGALEVQLPGRYQLLVSGADAGAKQAISAMVAHAAEQKQKRLEEEAEEQQQQQAGRAR